MVSIDRLPPNAWFQNLPGAFTEALLRRARVARYENRDTLYTAGEQQGHLWCVLSGFVKMHVAMNESEPRFAHMASSGFWFGENEIILGQTSIVEASVSGETELIKIRRTVLLDIAKTQPSTWQYLAQLAALNQALAVGGADDLMLRGARKRLAAVLLRLSSNRCAFQGISPTEKVPVTQSEIGEAANIASTGLTSLLAEFSKLGAIEIGYRSITISSPDLLEAEIRK